MPYLSVDLIKDSIKKGGYKQTSLETEFLEAYENKAKGNYKNLRAVYGKDGVSWDIIRNRNLNMLDKEAKLVNDNFEPTKQHFQRIAWAFSNENKLKAYIAKRSVEENDGDSKRKRK